MAAPTYVDHTTASSLTSPITGTKPTGTLDGHLLLAHLLHVTGNLAVDPTAPSGWTLISPGRQAHSSSTSWYYWKIASSEPSTWDWSHATSDDMIIGIVAISGVDQATPLHQTHLLMDTNIGSTTVALTVTTTLADCLLVAFAGQDQTAAGNTWSQASMTERYDEELLASLLTHCGYTETAATATTYNRTITASTAQRISGALIAIAPAGGDVTSTPAAIAVIVAAPQATPVVTDTAAPDATAVVVAAPQATVAISDTGAPDAVAGVVALPQATVTGDAAVTPASISSAITLPSSARNIGAGPAVIPVVVSLPQATPTSAGNATASPAAVAALVSAPQASATGTALASPAVVSTTIAAPQATPSGGATVAPDRIAATVTAPQAQPAVDDTAAPATISALAGLPSASALGGAVAAPGVIVTVITLPLPHLTEPRDIVVIARLRSDHVTGDVGLADLVAGVRSSHITGGVDVPRNMLTGSVEYVTAEVKFVGVTAADIATTTGVVQFTTTDTTPPANDPNWAAPDVTERTDSLPVGIYALLALKKLHTAGVAGEYRVWAKVSDNPEVPILKCGTFTVR